MKKIEKLIGLLLVVALVGAAIGGTLAYLQDTDSDVNVMTLGSVYITQNEHQRVDPSKNGTLTEADIEDFVQSKPIYPYVDENLNGAMRDDYEEITFPDGNTYKLFIGDNAIDKFVSVTNTGKTDAYVRTIVALEAPTDKIDLAVASKKGWTVDSVASSQSIEVDGVKYDLFVCEYNNVLKPGETTPYSLLQIILDGTATNEDAAAYDETYDVLVLSQAVQAEGFADATTALNAGFGVVDVENATAWFGGVWEDYQYDLVPKGDDESKTYPIPEGTEYTTVSNSDELKAALNNKANVILLEDGEYNWSGTGHNGTSQTVSIYGESKNAILYHTFEGEGNTDYDFDGYTVTFNNLTISGENNGASYPGWARMSATYNDCVIKQTYGLYSGTHEFNYCTFDVTGDQYNVWTWGAENATFNRCTFNSDGKAVLLYGQVNTKLTVDNCVFNDKGGLTDLKAAIEIGNDYGKSYELIVNYTTVNGYEINDKGINTGTTLWANKNSMGTDNLNVVVDGVDVY